VLDALRGVIDPDLGKDIVSLGFVKRLEVSDAGAVAFVIELTTPACPVKDRLQAQAQALVAAVPGVSSVNVEMTAAVRTAAVLEGGRVPARARAAWGRRRSR
jgi:ATP-binding protein involved in chromosome partitioning